MGEYSPAKTGEFLRITPDFQNCVHCKKDLKDNKSNSAHLGRKDARIFVLGNYLFLAAHSFPQAMLSENCSLLRTDNIMSTDKYPNIFSCQIEAIVYILCIFLFPCQPFWPTNSFKYFWKFYFHTTVRCRTILRFAFFQNVSPLQSCTVTWWQQIL